jgi:hypothetical protein
MAGQHATREQRDWVVNEHRASTAEIHSHEPVTAVDLARTHWVGAVPNTGLTPGEPASRGRLREAGALNPTPDSTPVTKRRRHASNRCDRAD